MFGRRVNFMNYTLYIICIILYFKISTIARGRRLFGYLITSKIIILGYCILIPESSFKSQNFVNSVVTIVILKMSSKFI